MTWSINFTGKPKAVSKALKDHSATLTGWCKHEYDRALPHLVGAVEQNMTDHPSYSPPTIQISASGSGSWEGGKQTYGSLSVTINYFNSKIVEEGEADAP
jgi:hypothetical protein